MVLMPEMRIRIRWTVAVEKMSSGLHGRQHRCAVRHIEAIKKFADEGFLGNVDVVAVLSDVEADILRDWTSISTFKAREELRFECGSDLVRREGEENVVDVIDEVYVVSAVGPAQKRVGAVHRSETVGKKEVLESGGPRSWSNREAIKRAFELEDCVFVVARSGRWTNVDLSGVG